MPLPLFFIFHKNCLKTKNVSYLLIRHYTSIYQQIFREIFFNQKTHQGEQIISSVVSKGHQHCIIAYYQDLLWQIKKYK